MELQNVYGKWLPKSWGYCAICKAAGCDWCGGYGFCPLKYHGVDCRHLTREMFDRAMEQHSKRNKATAKLALGIVAIVTTISIVLFCIALIPK